MVLTWLVTSFVLMLAPVWLGRKIFQLFVTDKKYVRVLVRVEQS